ncbi:MAG: hypothetical protein AB2760_02250 [Candidatus Thiodiazotropha endolucinida]
MARDNTSGKTRAARIRATHRDELRERLAAGGHLDHIIQMIETLRDFKQDLTQVQVQRLKAAIEGKIGLVDRYLPKLKSVEHSGEVGTGLSELLIQARDYRAQRGEPEETTQDDEAPSETTKH